MVLKFFIIFSIHNFSLFSLKSTFWSKFIILHLFLYKLPKIYKLLLFSHYIYTFVLNKLLFFILWEIFFNVHDHIASFFSFSSLEKFWHLSRAFFVAFLYFLDIIWQMKAFSYIHMKKIIKKMDLRIYVIHKTLVLIEGNIFRILL